MIKSNLISFMGLATVFLLTSFLLLSSQLYAENNNSEFEVIQFHLERRCITCKKIEALTREVLATYPNVAFRLINAEIEAEKVNEFQVTGTSLFLFNTRSKMKKDITDFAFLNAHNEDKFKKELKSLLDNFVSFK